MYRKHIRLPAKEYIGTKTYFATICCHENQAIFQTVAQGQWAIKHLLQSASKHAFLLHAYCIMPNHLHLLAESTDKSSTLQKFITHFKQCTAYYFKEKTNRPLWQPYFHDHILRDSQCAEPVAQYIWLNPVRKNLRRTAQDYELSGSQTVNWKEYSAKSIPPWLPPWKLPSNHNPLAAP